MSLLFLLHFLRKLKLLNSLNHISGLFKDTGPRFIRILKNETKLCNSFFIKWNITRLVVRDQKNIRLPFFGSLH